MVRLSWSIVLDRKALKDTIRSICSLSVSCRGYKCTVICTIASQETCDMTWSHFYPCKSGGFLEQVLELVYSYLLWSRAQWGLFLGQNVHAVNWCWLGIPDKRFLWKCWWNERKLLWQWICLRESWVWNERGNKMGLLTQNCCKDILRIW